MNSKTKILITAEERQLLEPLFNQNPGLTFTHIAQHTGRSVSSIIAEYNRGLLKNGKYSPRKAEKTAQESKARMGRRGRGIRPELGYTPTVNFQRDLCNRLTKKGANMLRDLEEIVKSEKHGWVPGWRTVYKMIQNGQIKNRGKTLISMGRGEWTYAS